MLPLRFSIQSEPLHLWGKELELESGLEVRKDGEILYGIGGSIKLGPEQKKGMKK